MIMINNSNNSDSCNNDDNSNDIINNYPNLHQLTLNHIFSLYRLAILSTSS